MKALLIRGHGDLDQVRFEEIEEPAVGPGDVLVETRASALNHLDLFVVGGLPGRALQMPHVLGSDAAGIVAEAGAGVERFSVGDRVMLDAVLSCGQCEFCERGEESLCVRLRLVGETAGGVHAERFVVPERNLRRVPEGVSFEKAAAYALVFRTAWRMLKTRARLGAGEDIFIHGIGGGVSTAALAVSNFLGARALVSSSSDLKLERAGKMGAEFAFNYASTDVVREVLRVTQGRGVDVVVDSVGDATWVESLKMVRKGGRIVTCGATTGPSPRTDIRMIFWKQVEILGSTMSSAGEFDEVVKLLGEGKLEPVVDARFPLCEGRKALRYLGDREQFGKVVLTPG